MKTRLALGLLLSSTIAAAQPSPGFAKQTTYEYTTHSTMFACGMRDAQGHTYGTAKEITIVTRTTFRVDGTYFESGKLPLGTGHGRYRVTGKTVTLTPIEDDGSVGKSYDMILSADGSTLGSMKRI